MNFLSRLAGHARPKDREGICSVCSANEWVIEAAAEEARYFDAPLLVEATANQVNQDGGYTGKTPAQFRGDVLSIAKRCGCRSEQVVLGGDHLGPLVWAKEDARTAMRKAEELVAEFAKAGFEKIHLDTSMRLGDDTDEAWGPAIVAERGARLCEVAERAAAKAGREPPVYVIGSEVPTPGGTKNEQGLQVTRTEDFVRTIELFQQSFLKRGLADAWIRVIAVVVQPGVEFGVDNVHNYSSTDAKELREALRDYPSLVFEGHSTDYQSEPALRKMVEDGIAILKVGPALTYALREGLVSLECMEKELVYGPATRSDFMRTLDQAMCADPSHWRDYYQGNEQQRRLLRCYSYSDRCRYYLNDPKVLHSVRVLLENLRVVPIPPTLISQYFPWEYWKTREISGRIDPLVLVKLHIQKTLDQYYRATSPR